MKTEEFWQKYVQDKFEIFDEALDFFSNKLPKKFIENYDVEEVILEIIDHQENAKNFDNALKFIDILQHKQPDLYKENFEYFDDFLIDYFCFHQDVEKVQESFSNFLHNPLHNYEKYLLVFKKFLFYQHSSLLEQAISENYDEINRSDDLIGGAEYDLALCYFYMELQNIYKKQKEILDKDAFSSTLSKYHFEFKADVLSSLEKGICKPPIDATKLKNLFKKDRNNCIVILQRYFLRYMNDKGFQFYLSGRIWSRIFDFLEKNCNSKKTTNTYFNIKAGSFEKYLSGLTKEFFMDDISEMIAILWGSIYLYEFLYEFQIISENMFHDFITISRELKGKVIGQFTPDLWNSNFVHCWEKPDCISENEFSQENNIFIKSFSLKHKSFAQLKSEISEELSKIGALSSYILEEGKEDKKLNQRGFIDDILSSYQEEFDDSENNKVTHEPVVTEKKIGRNKPCPCGSGKKYKNCCGKKV